MKIPVDFPVLVALAAFATLWAQGDCAATPDVVNPAAAPPPAGSASTPRGTVPVPEPWTPLEVDGDRVRCWNRDYVFEDGLLPSNILSGGADVLSGPIQLSVKEMGREVFSWSGVEQDWKDIRRELIRSDPDVVELTTSGRSDLMTAECRFRIEFDGFVLCDLTITPRRPTVDVRRIDLILPLRRETVRLFHHSPLKPVAQWDLKRDPYWSGAVPAAGLFLPFVNNLWVGNEERGLNWFTESDEGLSPLGYFVSLYADSSMVLSLSGQRTLTAENPFRFRFGLMATPVKPLRPLDRFRWAWHLIGDRYLKGDAVDPAPTLEAAAAAGVNCSFASTVSDILWHMENDPGYRENWKRLMDTAAKFGIDIECSQSWVTEQPSNGSHHNPEGLTDEWLLEPRLTIAFRENPAKNQHLFCQKGPFSKWLADGARKVIVEYGAGGIYLDGPGIPQHCTNLRHGCGYVDSRGVHPTFPILATRELMKQLYLITRAAGKHIVAHMSGNVTPATLSFADVILGGEHIASWYPGQRPDYTLESFRAEIAGRQFGLPALWLYTNRERPTLQMALSLLHNISPLWGGPETAGFLRAYSDFGAADAEWVGYWEEKRPVTAESGDVLISSYVRRGTGTLSAAANLSNSPIKTRLSVDRAALGLKRASVSAVMSAEATLEPEDSGWTVHISPGGWLLFEVNEAD